MQTLWFVLRAVAAVAAVLPLRLVRGRRHGTWTMREELVNAGASQFVRAAASNGFVWARSVAARSRPLSSLAKQVEVEETELGGVGCERVNPRDAEIGSRIVIYFHGGGYVVGSPAFYRDIVARLAVDCRASVISPRYRLGPESPHPAAQEDCLACYRALLAHPPADSSAEVVLAGDSAGGALVLSTLLEARRIGLALPRAAVLYSPWVDPGFEGGSMDENEGVDSIDGLFLGECLASFLDGVDVPRRGQDSALAGRDLDALRERHPKAFDDPRLFPAHAELGGLPPLLVQVGDAEVLRDQVLQFAQRASSAGVDVTLKVYEDVFHIFQNFHALLPRADAAVAESTAFVRAHFSSLERRASRPGL